MKIHVVLGPRQPYRAARAAFRELMAPVLTADTQLVTMPHLGPQTWALELAVAAGAQVHLWHGAGFRALCWPATRVVEDVVEDVLEFRRADVAHGKKKYDPDRVRQEMLAWLVEQAKKHQVLVHAFDEETVPEGLEAVRWTWDAKAMEYTR